MDSIIQGFLQQQKRDALLLNRESDLVKIEPAPAAMMAVPAILRRRVRGGTAATDAAADAGGVLPDRYIVHLHCNGLVQLDDGSIEQANHFAVGVWFPDDYLKRATAPQTLTLLSPHNTFHPNVNWPFICLDIEPGTGLVDIAYALFAVFSYQKLQLRHGLNIVAETYARRPENRKRFPTDRRPLKRARAEARSPVAEGGAA